MPNIHWAGTGLSAIPGLRRLIIKGYQVRVYNRSIEKARQAVSGLEGNFQVDSFDLETLREKVSAQDVVVSMLPGDFHVPLAKLCLEKGAHFVSSSYISDEMRALNQEAQTAGLCLVNEVGLDPGIDHNMAHALVDRYRHSAVFSASNQHAFTSYCGGLSKTPNDFCYKFSWSPLGVLRALKSESVSIRNGSDYKVKEPWTAVDHFSLDMPWGDETFEVYPNRDSRPFLAQYHFGDDWNVREFVRGTLRYHGWKAAWQPIFNRIEQGISDDELAALSEDLWQKYAFGEEEADRVVLAVTLKVARDEGTVWHQSYLLDAYGNQDSSAMARLVSIPVSLAVEAVMKGEIAPGVSAAPDKPALVERWLTTVDEIADHFVLIDHLRS